MSVILVPLSNVKTTKNVLTTVLMGKPATISRKFHLFTSRYNSHIR
uniref:Uncharacterized protein n=1 Tax=Arundo donax TaxID=35708 RepID=A0A0A9C5U5_ARUDO